jgi:GTP-binding protein
MFVDQTEIYVRGGNGGRGCVSFRRERFKPKGGPDGGNGGRGGDVWAHATPGVDTLLDFSGRHHWIAENGRPGEGNDCAGRSGEDVVLRLPPGTLIFDRDSGVLLKDLKDTDDRVCLAEGGAGGRGNKSFTTPTHQAPREAEPGEPGRERWLRLELKLIADAGLVGLPNAGKSTLLSCLSKARPKIAPYPFTTVRPQLGIAELPGFRRMVLADIPGLVEGAHQGAGLGDEFLRHIERTRVIVHMIDICPLEGAPSPADAYGIVRRELAEFSPKLAEKAEVIVANKMDLSGAAEALHDFREQIGRDVWPISAVTRQGIGELAEQVWRLVEQARPAPPAESPSPVVPPHMREVT